MKTQKPTVLPTGMKLVEQALILNIRFAVLMYQRRGERQRSPLLAAISAFKCHLNLNGMSAWVRDNFYREPGFYAGYWWFVVCTTNGYQLLMNDSPFTASDYQSHKVNVRPRLTVVHG